MIIWFIYSKFDWSKSFDCVNHEIYVVRFATYCFISESPIFVWSSLTDWKQRIRINHSHNLYSDATCGVPLLCLILTFVTCVFWIAFLTLLAMLMITQSCLVKSEKENVCKKLLAWFGESHMTSNSDIRHLLISRTPV